MTCRRTRRARTARGSQHPTVVGIGASAGGLAALKAFFAQMPADSGLVCVVAVHLTPEHVSHLAELLQRHSPIPVQQVTQTTELAPDPVYVIPRKRERNVTGSAC